jgi:hypothetical protein
MRSANLQLHDVPAAVMSDAWHNSMYESSLRRQGTFEGPMMPHASSAAFETWAKTQKSVLPQPSEKKMRPPTVHEPTSVRAVVAPRRASAPK